MAPAPAAHPVREGISSIVAYRVRVFKPWACPAVQEVLKNSLSLGERGRWRGSTLI
jgi:hypothetical protein